LYVFHPSMNTYYSKRAEQLFTERCTLLFTQRCTIIHKELYNYSQRNVQLFTERCTIIHREMYNYSQRNVQLFTEKRCAIINSPDWLYGRLKMDHHPTQLYPTDTMTAG